MQETKLPEREQEKKVAKRNDGRESKGTEGREKKRRPGEEVRTGKEGREKKRRLVQKCARKETAAEGPERGEKSAGRGKRYEKRTKRNYARGNRNRGALIKTPVGKEVCVNGGCERRRQR